MRRSILIHGKHASRVAVICNTQQGVEREVLLGIRAFALGRPRWTVRFFRWTQASLPVLRRLLLRWRPEGIVAYVSDAEQARLVRSLRIPAVDCTDALARTLPARVMPDNLAVGRLAAHHLAERAGPHLFVVSPGRGLWAIERARGFLVAARGMGLLAEEYSHEWDSYEERDRALSAFLSSIPKPAGIFACNDAEAGATLGNLPATNGGWGSGFVAAAGDRIFKGWGGDCKAPPLDIWQVALAGDQVSILSTGVSDRSGCSHGPFALSDKVIAWGGGLSGPATGKTIGQVKQGTTTICGNLLLANAEHGADRLGGRRQRLRKRLSLLRGPAQEVGPGTQCHARIEAGRRQVWRPLKHAPPLVCPDPLTPTNQTAWSGCPCGLLHRPAGGGGIHGLARCVAALGEPRDAAQHVRAPTVAESPIE